MRFPVARDVAARAAVSTATVSRVLNGAGGVKPAKRAAVLKAAADLGFVANAAARALTRRRFETVGAVIPNIENDEFIRAISAFQAGLRRAGYTLLLTSAGYDLDVEMHEATLLLERGIDGLLLVGDIHRAALIERIRRQGLPMVQTFTLSSREDCVGFDNVAAAAKATNFLLDLGHRRIGVITGTRQENDRAGPRAHGLSQALVARGLALRPEHDVVVGFGIGAGRDGLRQLLSQPGERPTAILCGTDQLAFGAMIEANAQGLRIPHDLSVIGFNDTDYAAFLSPGLTTVRVHAADIGRVASDHLIARISGRSTVRVNIIDAELIVRGSTAPPGDRPRGR